MIEKNRFKKECMSLYKKIIIFLYFTFLGPVYYLFIDLVYQLQLILQTLIIIIIPSQWYPWWKEKVDSIVEKFGVDDDEVHSYLDQKNISKVFFNLFFSLYFDRLHLFQER